MPYCVMKDCKNYSLKVKKTDGISYFRFPRDPIRYATWIKTIAEYHNDEYFQPKQTANICSDHFKESDMYMTPKRRRRLIKTAIPDLQVRNDISNIPESHEETLTGVSVNENKISDEYIPTRGEGTVYIVTIHDDSKMNDVISVKHEVDNDTVTSVPVIENTVKHNMTDDEQDLKITASSAFLKKHTTISKSPAATSLSLDSILNTPRKVMIKKELRRCKRKILLRNKELSAIKNRNKWLIKQNTKLKIALKALQKGKNIEQSKI